MPGKYLAPHRKQRVEIDSSFAEEIFASLMSSLKPILRPCDSHSLLITHLPFSVSAQE